jgi:hypothetical protein
MNALIQQRCHLHSNREAVARCPDCERFYCRECITEHEGRVICTHCLGAYAAPLRRTPRSSGPLLFVGALAGTCLLWLLFLLVGHLLMLTPEKYHENTYAPVERLVRAMEGDSE